MPDARTANAVRLKFAPDSLVQSDLSGAAFTGGWFWAAGDEACGLLHPVGREALRFGEVRNFPLADLLDLPGTAGEEADLEGMAVAAGFLGVVGSPGLKRKNAKPDRGHADNARLLSKAAQDGRRALRLKGDARTNLLTCALADDPNFGLYMATPGKENGFDIEGLAVDGRRLLLGLRGPVLRGWSALLEIAVEGRGDRLRLAPLDDNGTLIRKHFLQFDDLGVRDLHCSGDDLYILSGPTMVLGGDVRVFKRPAARPQLAACREPVRFESVLTESVLTESVPQPHARGTNRAEVIRELPPALSCGMARWLGPVRRAWRRSQGGRAHRLR